LLIANGAWAAELLCPLGYILPVAPVRGQIVLFNPGRPVISRVLMVGKRYLVPRSDGRILVGSTEEPEAGFVKANTPEGVNGLIEFACGLVPALRDAPVETTWAGLRPGSPDGLPFIGPVPGYDNLFAAVGHGRAGVQLSIGTAHMVADLILGRPNPDAAAFRLDRRPDGAARPAFRS
jgi:glycine oxidase